MEKIYSKTEQGRLLHVVFRKEDFSQGRNDISHPDEFLQVSALTVSKGKQVTPHKHKKHDKTASITQESLIVIDGAIEAKYYDLDNNQLFSTKLKSGDITVTFHGGHSFSFIEDNTKVYELKNGPYLGKDFDHESI